MTRLRCFGTAWSDHAPPSEQALRAATEAEGSRIARSFVASSSSTVKRLRLAEVNDDLLRRAATTLPPTPPAISLHVHRGLVLLVGVAEFPFVTGSYSVLPVSQTLVMFAAIAIAAVTALGTMVTAAAGARLTHQPRSTSPTRDRSVFSAGCVGLFGILGSQAVLRERYLAVMQQGGQAVDLRGIGTALLSIQLGLVVLAVASGILSHSPEESQRRRDERRRRRRQRHLKVNAESRAAAEKELALLRLTHELEQTEAISNYEVAVSRLRARAARSHPAPIDPGVLARPPQPPRLGLPDLHVRPGQSAKVGLDSTSDPLVAPPRLVIDLPALVGGDQPEGLA
jgi:hypothetical protein